MVIFYLFNNIFFELYNIKYVSELHCKIIIGNFSNILPNKILFSILKVMTLYNKQFYNEFLQYDLFYLNLSFSQKETLLKLSLL
jgi:hypothetical protein